MAEFSIRTMVPDDAAIGVALARAQGWRDRTRFYEIVFRTETCIPLVGEVDGSVVATGIGVVNGPVGWLGALIVDEPWRGRGYGRAMTEELMRRLRDAGCRTLSLEATDAGRPLYERLGFREATTYHQLQAERLEQPPAVPPDRTLRRLLPADLPEIVALDRAATDEERSVPLRVIAELYGGWVLETLPDGGAARTLAGFLMPAERAYGAVIAPRFEDGLFLLDLHRSIVPAGANVRAGIPHEHAAAWRELRRRGWVETWRAPRMLLGPSPAWRPKWIWGQINSGMG